MLYIRNKNEYKFYGLSRQYKNHWEKAKDGKRQNLKHKDRQWNRKKNETLDQEKALKKE